MSTLLTKLTTFLESVSARERALILVAAMGAIFVLWDGLMLRPTQSTNEVQGTRRITLDKQLAALELKAQTAKLRLGMDPHARRREQLTSLEDELERIDERLKTQTEGIVPPDEMAELIERLLLKQGGVKLIRLEALPVESLTETSSAESTRDGSHGSIFKHGMRLEIEGSYRATLEFLERVEKLPWSFFWDQLHYDVTAYPVARVTLVVHTFSTREGWIGV